MAVGIARLSVPFEGRLIKPDIRNVYFGEKAIGFEFYVTSNGYRGTYLSCVEHIAFKVDGKEVPEDKIVFVLNGKRFLLNQLSDLFAEYLFTLDYATIIVYQDGGIAPGEHTVEYSIRTRIPFSGYFGEYEQTSNTVVRTLTLKEGRE